METPHVRNLIQIIVSDKINVGTLFLIYIGLFASQRLMSNDATAGWY